MAERSIRADAQRNREQLLQAALHAFSGAGAADVSLEAIAKAAGVGIGTLYRHFPSRDALVEAVYRTELARLCDASGELLATEAPAAALREWMGRFVAFQATKHGMADALHAVIASGGNPFEETRARLLEAVGTLAQAGVASGALRDDVEPVDILTALLGLSLASVGPAQSDRLLDLLLEGLRRRA
ncbi:MAG: TetR family transcriptional regulator [Candidatus Dormiibacterota bacterium]